YRQLSLFKSMRESLRGGASSMREQMSAARRFLADNARPIGGATGAAAAAVVLLVWLRRRRVPASALAERARSRDPMVQLYGKVLDRLARRGHRRHPATTPREHARALLAASVPGAPALGELTEL